MVLITAVRDYVNRMLQDISGMKVLILDSQTVIVHSLLTLFHLYISSPLGFFALICYCAGNLGLNWFMSVSSPTFDVRSVYICVLN